MDQYLTHDTEVMFESSNRLISRELVGLIFLCHTFNTPKLFPFSIINCVNLDEELNV